MASGKTDTGINDDAKLDDGREFVIVNAFVEFIANKY